MPQCAHEQCRRWRPQLLVRYARLGLRVDGNWFCSSTCVTDATSARLEQVPIQHYTPPRLPPLRLGTLLIHAGAISPMQLNQALRSQASSGLKLGAELRRLGHTGAPEVLRALASQAGTSYVSGIDPRVVRSAPGGLSPQEVQALGIVPFRIVEDDRLVMVACTAPVPRTALGALHQLVRYRPVPYLVTDEEFDVLVAAYGTDQASAQQTVSTSWVDSVHDAARRIAAMASREGDVTVSQARLDPLMWVRVTGKHGVDAMLVTEGATPGASTEAWLADTTRH